MDAPLPTFDDLFTTPSNQPTRATSPTEGDSTQMLTSKEQKEADEKETQRFADTEDKGDLSIISSMADKIKKTLRKMSKSRRGTLLMKIMIEIQEVENNNDTVPPPQVTGPNNVRPTFILFNIAK